VAHVLVSIVLGAVIIAIGLQFRSAIQTAQNAIVGSLLIATGAGFLVLDLVGAGHGHAHDHDHEHAHEHDHPHHSQAQNARQLNQPSPLGSAARLRGLAAVMVPFGAAASPDLTILPVFLAAATVGLVTAVASLAAFAVVTIGTIVVLTLVAARGGYEIRGRWLERWGNVLTALVLVLIGLLVLTGVI
jgi:threonine/homoserine/homoserine lactone efflux protein